MSDRDFKDTFDPRPGVDYGWVVAYAREQFAATLGVFKDLEDKAAWLIGYVGGGASLVGLGAVVALVNAKIPPHVAWAAVAPVACAVVALYCAVSSRMTAPVYYPPAVRDAARYAEFFGDRAEAAFLGQLHLCVSMMHPVLQHKAAWLEWGMRFTVATVAAMLVPLLVALLWPVPCG